MVVYHVFHTTHVSVEIINIVFSLIIIYYLLYLLFSNYLTYNTKLYSTLHFSCHKWNTFLILELKKSRQTLYEFTWVELTFVFFLWWKDFQINEIKVSLYEFLFLWEKIITIQGNFTKSKKYMISSYFTSLYMLKIIWNSCVL